MRPLREQEIPLLRHLLSRAGRREDPRTLRVADMSDGGMGSLSFGPEGSVRFGGSISECTFVDSDGVPVTASLYVNENGALLEMDVWKVDFSPLQSWPTALMLGGAG